MLLTVSSMADNGRFEVLIKQVISLACDEAESGVSLFLELNKTPINMMSYKRYLIFEIS